MSIESLSAVADVVGLCWIFRITTFQVWFDIDLSSEH